MSIISQAAVLLMIVGTVLILVRSNRDLKTAYEEGEHFIDEWAAREVKLDQKRKDLKEIPEQKTVTGTNETEDDNTTAEELPMMENVIPMKKRVPVPMCLEIFDESTGDRETVRIERVPFSIGRGSDNDLILNDLYVAKHHLAIDSEEEGWSVHDFASSNHILSEGRPVTRMSLQDGAEFSLGFLHFRFQSGAGTVPAGERDLVAEGR